MNAKSKKLIEWKKRKDGDKNEDKDSEPELKELGEPRKPEDCKLDDLVKPDFDGCEGCDGCDDCD